MPKWRTILRVVLPTALPGIITGAMLAVARITGETAPLLLTMFISASINFNPFTDPQATLPTFIWDQIARGTPASLDRAWAGALTLILHRRRSSTCWPGCSAGSTESSSHRSCLAWPSGSTSRTSTSTTATSRPSRVCRCTVEPRSITAFIGPSGCGKSTVLRTLNRMHEVIPGARVEGKVLLDGEDIYASDVDPVNVRRTIGMVFQKPNPFPTMSIYDNVVAGLKLQGRRKKPELDDIVERSLRGANLWEEVKDRLNRPGSSLSGGQQQRLCIARAIAVEPQVLLMDEPCSALDPISTLAIEDLMQELKRAATRSSSSPTTCSRPPG